MDHLNHLTVLLLLFFHTFVTHLYTWVLPAELHVSPTASHIQSHLFWVKFKNMSVSKCLLLAFGFSKLPLDQAVCFHVTFDSPPQHTHSWGGGQGVSPKLFPGQRAGQINGSMLLTV